MAHMPTAFHAALATTGLNLNMLPYVRDGLNSLGELGATLTKDFKAMTLDKAGGGNIASVKLDAPGFDA